MLPTAIRSPMVSTIVLAALCSVLAFVPENTMAWLAYDRQAILAGEIWRLWTGHLVHFSVQHALSDIIVLLILGKIAEHAVGTRTMGWTLFVCAPIISVILLITEPDLIFYRGLSGLSVFIGVAVGTVLWHRASRLHGILTLLGALLAGKIMLDATGYPLLSSVPAGVKVAWQAHVIGGILGGLAAIWHERRLWGVRFGEIWRTILRAAI